MARRSRMTMLKRQREAKKAEKAAAKRAKRHGTVEAVFTEPKPTVDLSALNTDGGDDDDDADKD